VSARPDRNDDARHLQCQANEPVISGLDVLGESADKSRVLIHDQGAKRPEDPAEAVRPEAGADLGPAKPVPLEGVEKIQASTGEPSEA
jgi:hypothetical protein